MLGMMVGSILLLFLAFAIISAIAASADTAPTIEKNTLLHITLAKPIYERKPENPFDFISSDGFDMEPALGLDDIIANINKAQHDENIIGIYLELGMFECGFSTLQEIRNALTAFKKSKKFIICHSDLLMQRAYYLASVADKIYLTPQGILDIRGLSSSGVFIKGTLDKLEIKPVIFKGRDNKYKSAVEPLTSSAYSENNKEQISALLGDLWADYITQIENSRNISSRLINNIADSLKLRKSIDAVTLKLIDQLYFKDQVNVELQKRCKVSKEEDLKLVTLHSYSAVPDKKRSNINRKNKIAIVYATGEITTGKSNENSMGAETIVKALQDARKDSSVKAIVLRINSPGGGVGASEIIYREVLLAKQTKPVVVSMSDVAASGGYWIASCATKIIANPNTITGSIGVFGVTMNIRDFLKNKLGVTLDQVKTNEYADMLNPGKTLTPFEVNAMQEVIDNIYNDFVNNVATNRKLKPSYVDSIAKGRIWSGVQAKKIGLVDELGDLNYAIIQAAKIAKIDSYRLTYLPEAEDPLTQFMNSISGNQEQALLQKTLGSSYGTFLQFQTLSNMQGIQARMPYIITIE